MRYALVYGLLSGLVSVGVIISGFLFPDELSFLNSYLFGYLVMLVALTFVFVGVKRYRDVEHGGVIRFLPAFGLGLAIAVVAGVAYALAWEGYLAATGYRFMDDYVAGILRKHAAAGASAAALARESAELNAMKVQYANPLFRFPMTFLEIFPVGAIVALVSAALLRNPRLLPARV